ncbi:AGAP002977-PA-like protein [Anopheles sinensis]|uniref:AGAP002977-PA-like protein n=1 Tax=Anopheles sinensis TaxID=74873 RepID=A0A084VDB2_ANOSI|nr:AGAP002977-PA-like protein [Anopheles sinensis]
MVLLLLLGALLQQCGSSAGNATVVESTTKDGMREDPAPQKILSRKRRFLTFPEGSSFQVVYDQTIPMIGVERLFTIGITVALAYELPSITINQIEQMLQENAAEGYIFPKMDANVNQTVLVDTNVTPARKNIFSYYYQTPRPVVQAVPNAAGGGRINYYTASGGPDGNRRYDKYDRYGQRLSQWDRFVSSGLPRPPYVNPSGNDFGSIVNRYIQNWVRRHPPNYPVGKKRFYPVFGKRSIREDTDPLDRHFLNHHRVTRHALYERIEQFLTALPPTHETPNHHKHRLYDEAHAHTGNCAETYSYCEDSFWSSDFVF